MKKKTHLKKLETDFISSDNDNFKQYMIVNIHLHYLISFKHMQNLLFYYFIFIDISKKLF